MDPIIIAVIVVLCQYPLAILTLLKLFRLNLQKNKMLVWNIFVIAVPFVGVISFWIYYLATAKKRKIMVTSATDNGENSHSEE